MFTNQIATFSGYGNTMLETSVPDRSMGQLALPLLAYTVQCTKSVLALEVGLA